MSVQDKIKIFNQLKLDPNQNKNEKNMNLISKEKELFNKEELKIKKMPSEMKKENIKEKIKSNEDKEKSKDNEKKESFDKKSTDNLSLNNIQSSKEIRRDKNPVKRQSETISTSILEKMKSLELYFKLRNDGWTKTNTELPKSLEKFDSSSNINNNSNNNNANNYVNTPLKVTKTIKENIKLDKLDNIKVENETMKNLEIEQDAYEFNEDNYKERRYDKNNVESGKKFFKLRYIKNKLKQNSANLEKKQKEQKEAGNAKEIDDTLQQSNNDKERILRKYNSDFIIIIEKSIISFNVKNYKESYEFLLSSGIIKNEGEYGEFLLVVSGFDKFLIGEFLAKQKFPNDKKLVLNNFIESINMKTKETKFIDCLRFLFSRLILPKDANLILEIMDKFSINYFETNKNNEEFVDIFKSSDKVYLLVSTILALNTMFTRKDIKIKNVIKKEEFIKMNSEISKDYLEKLYDELKKNPISMSDDYNESMYKKLAPLVKEDESNKLTLKNSKSGSINEENRNSNPGNEDKVEENNNSKSNEKISKDNNIIEEQVVEEDELEDELDEDESKKGIGKKEFSLATNLKNFTEEDEKLLKTAHKFYKITGSTKSSQREYILNERKTKLYYDKKQTKFIPVSNIVDVYNGVNHSHNSNINKYLKSNPTEEQFSGHFISLIFKNDKDQVDLMSDDLESALKWFKAIKSLILVESNKNGKSQNKAKLYENACNKKTDEIWVILLNKWNIYGKFLITKLMERNKYIQKDEKQNSFVFGIGTRLSNKVVYNFLRNIHSKKISKEKELDYNEFFTIYYLGLPNHIRNKIWQILIGNPCAIFINAYDLAKKQVPTINFSELDLNNPTNKNYCQDYMSNKIINEIIKSKDLFITDENNKNEDGTLIIESVYNIARGFFIFRPDIPYNKSIISIIFLFKNIFEKDEKVFCNLINVICSNEIKIFIGDEIEIKNYCSFFNYLLGKYLGKIEKHFSKFEITPQLYIIPWFEEYFTRTLNIKTASHLFDLFLISGEVILFQTSLAILKVLEEQLISLTINEVFKVLQRLPENVPEIDLFENIKKFSSIKKEFFDWKLQNELGAQKSELFEIILSSNN